MVDKNFVVKNGLVVNGQFTANSVSINHSTFLSGNSLSFNVGSPLYANSSTGITANNLLLQGDGTNATIKPTNSGSSLSIGSNNTTQITVAANGNVGIANAVPTDKLSVGGSAYVNGNLTLGSSTISAGLQANGSYGLAGQVLTSNGTATFWGAGGVAGTNTQIQFNDSGFANGYVGLTFNKTSNTLYIGNNITTVGSVTVGGSETISGSLTVSSNVINVGTGTYFVSNGNVGIGTTIPSNKLVTLSNINGNDGAYISNANTGASAQAVIALNTAGASGVSLGQNYTTKNAFLYLADNASLTLSTNATAALTVAANSNIGIGTSTPTYLLSVVATTTGGISVSNSTSAGVFGPSSLGGISLGTTGGSPLIFYTNNINRMQINAAGDIAVGSACNAVNALRYFDIYNQDTGASTGVDLRLFTKNVAGSGIASAEIIKTKLGVLSIKNNETDASAITQFNIGTNFVLSLDTNGNVIAPDTINGSMRARIFYDQNDTTYYVDPNSASNMNIIYVSKISLGYDAGQTNSIGAANWFRSSGTTGWVNDSFGGGIYMTENTTVKVYNDKMFYTKNKIFGTQFVDADDDTFYIDPNSSSKINSLLATGSLTTATTLYFGSVNGTVNTTGGPLHYADSTNHVIKPGSGNGSLYFQNYAGTNVASIYMLNGNANFPAYLDYNNGAYYVIPSGTSVLNNIQAKVYYDLDNTSYYCDPANISNFNILNLQPSGIYFQYGVQLYQDGAGNGPGDFVIRTYDQSGTYYYNVFYKNGNVQFPNQASAGSIVSSTSVSASSMQAPIYYDRDDNSYYLDPNQTSVLKYINHTGRSYYNYSGQYILGVNGGELLYYDGTMCSWGSNATYNMFQKQVRAPIYYDNDDTSYYCDPNYVSNMKRAIHKPVTAATNTSAGTGAVEIQNLGGTGDGDLAQLGFVCPGYYGINLNLRADGYFGLGGWSSAAWRWFVSPGGDMQAAGNVTAYSDPRLKENFKRVNNPLDIIRALDGGTFNWKHGIKHTETKAGKKDYGILADQVNAVMPEIVSDSIEIDGEKFKTVAYDKLVPVLIEAIKELEKRVAELEAK